jgi:large subunit ribosomal protein L6
MSRIGKAPITLPDAVTLVQDGDLLTVSGPLGQLSWHLPRQIKLKTEDKVLNFTRQGNLPAHRALHGLSRATVNNLVEGVTKGFTKHLEMVGTGYRVAKQGAGLSVSVGYSHPVEVTPPDGITLEIEGNNKIIVKGINKELVGQTAANIRKIRPPEPYKGKGIRYEGEYVRRKAGKAAKAAAA